MRPFSPVLLLAAFLAAVPALAQDMAMGEWRGRYTCLQGDTGLSLTIAPAAGGRLGGLFHFYGLPGGPAVPEGCFTMEGLADPATGRVTLEARDWLLRPPFFVTVDLDGQLEADGRLAGQVLGPNCTSFTLQRTPAAPRTVPAACRFPANVAALD